MATKAVTSLISSQIDRQLPLIRTKIRDEGKKKMHELREKLPSVNDLKDQFSSSACSLEAQEKMEKKFNDTKKIVEKIILAAEKGKEKLEKLLEKLRKILDSVIPKIQSILDFLKPIVIALRILIRVIPIILRAIPTAVPGITGGMIIAVDDKRKAAASKVGEWANLIIVMSDHAIPAYRAKTNKLITPSTKSLNIINKKVPTIVIVSGKDGVKGTFTHDSAISAFDRTYLEIDNDYLTSPAECVEFGARVFEANLRNQYEYTIETFEGAYLNENDVIKIESEDEEFAGNYRIIGKDINFSPSGFSLGLTINRKPPTLAEYISSKNN